jgi:capsular polysaccharide biosynthesis protein
MPPPIDLATNQLQEFLRLLIKNRWWILLPTFAGLTAGIVVLDFVPKRYESRTLIEVREIRFEEDFLARNPQDVPIKRNIQNVDKEVTATPRMRKVIAEKLQWPEFFGLAQEKEQDYLERVRERTGVLRAKKERDIGSDYVTIIYKDESPHRASAFANELRDVWMEETIASFKDQVQREFEEARAHKDRMQQQAHTSRNATRVWQEQNNLSPTLPIDRRTPTQEDWLTQRHQQLLDEQRGLAVDVEVADEAYRLAKDRWVSAPKMIVVQVPTGAPGTPSDPNSPLVDEQVKLQARITDLRAQQAGMKKANRRWQALAAQIQVFEEEIKSIQAKIVAPQTPLGSKPATQERFNEQRLVLEQEMGKAEERWSTLKKKLDQVNAQIAKEEPAVRQRAQVYERYHALEEQEKVDAGLYAEAAQALERKGSLLKKIASPAGNPFHIVEYANPADSPVEPQAFLYLAVSLLAGAGTGVALLFLLEYARPSFRSVEDAIASLHLPVLGSVSLIVTRSEVRRARVRQALIVGSSLALLGSIASVATVYLVQPRVLPRQVLEVLDTLKQRMR